MKDMEKITAAETIVLWAIWDCEKEPRLYDLTQITNNRYGKTWERSTVFTLIQRLISKKYVKMKRNGKMCTYYALVTKQEYRRQMLEDLYCDYYDLDKQAMKEDFQSL